MGVGISVVFLKTKRRNVAAHSVLNFFDVKTPIFPAPKIAKTIVWIAFGDPMTTANAEIAVYICLLYTSPSPRD